MLRSRSSFFRCLWRFASERGTRWSMTPAQCRAGRALLDWSQQQLADAARVGVVTVRQFEGAASQARNSSLELMQRALEAGGVIFVAENGDGPGVRLRKQREDSENLDDHISHLETKVGALKPAAS